MNEIINTDTNNSNMPQQEELQQSFNQAIEVVDDIVLKNYITQLQDLEVIPLDKETIERNLVENVRFFKITEMVYAKDEYSTYKFASVFNALSTINCAVFLIIDSDGKHTDFYMGIRSLDSERTTNSLKNTLQKAMEGQFPGIKSSDYLEKEMRTVVDNIKTNSISSVSCVANVKDDDNISNQSFIQGLDKLALSMQGEKYTAIVIANGTSPMQLSDLRKNYETIYTQLSPFANMQLNYATNQSFSLSNAFSKSTSNTKSYGTNTSETLGSSKSTNTTGSESISKHGTGSKIASGAAAATSMIGAALAPITGGMSLAVSGIVSGGLGLAGTALQKTNTKGTSTSESTSTNESKTHGTNETDSTGSSESKTNTKGMQSGKSQHITMTATDKSITNILERLDMQLKRLQDFESLGMWECSAYFMSENPYAAEIAASTYKALMRGVNSGVETSAINSWSEVYESDNTKLISEYVKNFIHPIFSYKNDFGEIPVTPCTLVSGNELGLHMGLPRKSVPGFPVIEHADFGKEVVTYDRTKLKQTINLGKIFNMGSEGYNRVQLSRESFTMHAFVTGSTGSGKSNTIYELLRQLNAANVKFMVVEPAKGEYKNVFGNWSDVNVLGTNPSHSKLLRINPFKFPKDIHVLEHIDRLIEIFNVCWPMFAAMPAVLKEAVLRSYEVSGWDLIQSKNSISDGLFPTFADLQNELFSVIDSSEYSQETKSDYIGSLLTRIKSLTNGLNGQIFSADEVDNGMLFNENVIIDLSRVGSTETKALIMGVLIMRLNEHRMSEGGMNAKLKHVTVLEEAHNILKRTSTAQDMESSNIAGKSVEMLSNSIAEMRTYGEGFIIADQSPSAVDISAIRNTNTKIIMRLPDELDRRLAGKSAALKDEQLDEIAKLPRGVAVIYQNNWVEPVLCKINKYKGEEENYIYEKEEVQNTDSEVLKKEIVLLLLKGRLVEKVEPNIDSIKKNLNKSDISTKNKIGIYDLVKEYEETLKLRVWENHNFQALSEMVTELLTKRVTIQSIMRTEQNYDDLNNRLNNELSERFPELSQEVIGSICQCFIRDYASNGEGKLEDYSAWREVTRSRRDWYE